MKKVILFQLAGFLGLLLSGRVWMMAETVLVSGILFVISLLVLLASLLLSLQQSRIQQHLIQENRRLKKKEQVPWSEEERDRLQLARKRVELSVLQNQINPHFLYNTLDSIRSKALIDGQKEIADMTAILSRFFRYCIGIRDNLVRVREELNHIEDYFYIQKFRFGDRFEMRIQLEDEDIKDLYIPKMTLQPLVENAMIHGLEKTSQNGVVRVRLMRSETTLVIIISDTGAGMPPEQLVELNEKLQQPLLRTGGHQGKSTGIAMSNINARLRITFGEAYGIRYRSLEGEGTDAIVTLPVIDLFSRVKYEEKFGA